MTKEYDPNRFWEYGKWAGRFEAGVRQFSYLVSCGLEPHHYLLDVGCGWLRGGINFIEYLDTGHYYGFDKEKEGLERGELLLKGKDLVHKNPVIRFVGNSKWIGSFIDREMKKNKFDYMIAYSVFTHTDPYMTERLFADVIPFLKDTGRFFATFFRRSRSGVYIGKRHLSRVNEYAVIMYPFYFFEDMASKYGMVVEDLEKKDSNNQSWMCFCKELSNAK